MFRPLFALFERSLREQSRTKFTFVCRTAIGILILFIVAENQRNFVNRPAPGQEVLMFLVWVNFFAITIFGLSTFTSAITEEKEEGSLGLMLMTRLNPLSILLGKSTARLFDGLMLLAVQVPFTMLCVTLGGVSRDQILRCYAILASFLFLLSNVSLLWSVVCRRTSRAASLTTLTGLMLYFLPLFFLSIVGFARPGGQGTNPSWWQTLVHWVISINPGFDLIKTTVPRGGFPFGADSIAPSLIGGLICFGIAWLLFAPCCSGTEEAAPRKAKKAAGNGPRRRFGVRRPGTWAIAWKDFHFLGGGYAGILIRAAIYGGLVALFIWWTRTIDRSVLTRQTVGTILATFGFIAFSVELGLITARLFGIERKHKTLGGLYTLPNGTGPLIWQKILGALPTFIPSAGMYFTGIAITTTAPGRSFWMFSNEASVMLFVSQYLFFAALVMYFSLRMRRAVLPTAIATLFFANVLVNMFLSGGSYVTRNATAAVLLGILVVVVAALIPKRLDHAAADE